MSDIQSLDRLHEHAIAALIPFVVESPTSDANAARIAAVAMLAEYKAATPKELQLATEIIALGWGALACLRAAAGARNLTIDQMLDVQDNAIALHRASFKSTKLLDARRKDRTKNPSALTPENTRWDEGVFQRTINKALEKVNDANVKYAAYLESLTPVVETHAVAEPPVVPMAKIQFLFGEKMTQAVLARRARH